MKIYEEINIRDFKFWSGAEDRAASLTDEDWDVVENELEQLYPDGISGTQLNDIFWFDFGWVVQFLGYEDEEDFNRKRDPNYVDDDELEEYVEDWWAEWLYVLVQHKSAPQKAELLDTIYADVFDGKADDVIGVEERTNALYKYLTSHYDSAELMEYLFDGDRGHNLLDNEIYSGIKISFPTKEQFRTQIMNLHSI